MTTKNNYQGVLQHPIGSGFNAASTTDDVIKGINLAGKTAIVTGGFSGIGLETTRSLAKAGAEVVVISRAIDKEMANGALAGIPHVELEEVDLMDPASIDRFADRFLASGRALHLLINNAGIMFVPLRRDTRGIESQLATNYLAAFHLTAKLWSALKKAKEARVINVSSQGHQFGPFHFDDPNFEHHKYESLTAYGQSKTAVNLFSMELDARALAHGIRIFAVHPGNTAGTNLAKEANVETLQKIGLLDEKGAIKKEIADTLKTIPQGAATTVWCATSPLLNDLGGVYCEDGDIAIIAPETSEGLTLGVKPYSLDKDNAKRLWGLSEQLTGITFQAN